MYNNKQNNKNWIKYIQTARTKLHLSDEEYISILLSAGIDSATQITTQSQFITIKKALTSLGFQPSSLQLALITKAKKVLGNSWKQRLEKFCKNKFGKSSVWHLTHKESRTVMGFLTSLEKKYGKE